MVTLDLSSIRALIGIFHLELAVLSPRNRIAAIPEDSVATPILRSFLTAASNKLQTNVFPVPPGASIKYRPPFFH